MRALPGTLALAVLGLLLFAGCNRNGSLGGSSATGDNQNQNQQPQGKKQPGGQGGTKETEPTGTVSGQPSTASDNGSPSAVAHRSVAEPGAPQGAVPDNSRKHTPKPASPQR
ncbi:MAG TPA: hypothetical protein VGM02_08600 [Acidobacteriaceae bacterium]|jgi:hypothetical protein